MVRKILKKFKKQQNGPVENKKMEQFEALLNKFYEADIYREVYRTEDTLICNVYNQFYAVFNLKIIAMSDEGEFFGFIMNSDNMKSLVKDPAFFKTYYESMSTDELKQFLISLDENHFKKLQDKRRQFESLPKSEGVDLEYEKKLKRK